MGLIYSNVVKHDNLSFEDYLRLPGQGHSFYKSAKDGIVEDFTPTEKMQLGSVVDLILTEPARADMNHRLYSVALRIAAKIQTDFGTYLRFMKSQVSYNGTVTDDVSGLSLAITGRLDYLLSELAVLDLKVTAAGTKSNPVGSLLALIEFMGYDNQLYNYGRMAKVAKHYILIHSTALNATYLFQRLTTPESIAKAEAWWAGKIEEHGMII